MSLDAQYDRPGASPDRAAPDVARKVEDWPLIALALAFALFHILTADTTGYGIFRDELYFVACGERLAFGYVDQPPGVAIAAWLTTRLFGSSLTALRLLPALALGGTVYVASLICRNLGGDRWSRALTVTAIGLAPAYVGTFGVLSMNAFDFLLWTIALFVFARLLSGAPTRGWLTFGVTAGLALQMKISFLFLGFGVVVSLLLTRRWDHLRSGWFWAGGLVALAIAAPFILWQDAHAWPMAELVAASSAKNQPHTVAAYLGQQILLMNPVTAPLWIGGLAYLLAGGAGVERRALGIVYLVVLSIMLLNPTSKAYFMGPAYPPLLAAGAVALQRGLASRHPWLTPVLLGITMMAGAALVPLTKPLLSPAAFERYSATLGMHTGGAEKKKVGRLPQFFADRMGWPELTHAIARVYRDMPPEERAEACIFTENYGQAGAIERYGPNLGLPPAISGHNNYWIWGPGSCSGNVLIVLSRRRGPVDALFDSVERGGTFRCTDCMPYEDDKPIWVARDPKLPLTEAWPQLKHID